MTVPSSLKLIKVNLKTRAYIQIIQCQGFVGTTMIEAILVALENSLNLVRAVCHYKSFVIAILPTSSEQGGELANLILMLLFLAAPQNVSSFYPFGV
jgi:hypothetical protein